jgi:hypothetical protein
MGRADKVQILTVYDPARKARIAHEAELSDHSRIRVGEWARAWDGYLKLAGEVWAGYLAYPVRQLCYDAMTPSRSCFELEGESAILQLQRKM